ncbi:PIN domain-containing protein [Okeanomitos corallinicola TIOX110]|uniref:PIN domain-containing protein n=1 Tax=Okeanomitos corallinicola TIOX110 TaxID=3133117 RepID=A0ABZ2UPN7_9CYAN
MNMRDLFPGYYQPTDQEFNELWKECIFSFDTNVLLHIYRYSPKSRERLFDILKKLQERIWIPHQVGYEFHKNRETVISSQSSAYDKIVKILEDNLKIEKIGNLNKDIDNFEQNYRKHSTIEVNKISVDIKTKIKESIKEIIESVKDDVKDLRDKHPDLFKEDIFLDKILDGRIGNPYPNPLDIYKLAEERFQYLIPPGYKDKDDKNKSVPDIYGDAILWLQLIDYAKSEKKPIIFVTDEEKEDWWLKNNRKIISPRPELVQEMLTEAGVKFYMYSADRFLDYAQKFLELTEQPEVIEEAREIREQNLESESLIAYQNFAQAYQTRLQKENLQIKLRELDQAYNSLKEQQKDLLSSMDMVKTKFNNQGLQSFIEALEGVQSEMNKISTLQNMYKEQMAYLGVVSL